MPVHRLPTAFGDLEAAVEQVEKGARIVGVVSEGPGSVIVFTEAKASRKAGARETR